MLRKASPNSLTVAAFGETVRGNWSRSTPNVIVYDVAPSCVTILRVWHGAQNSP
ncbi:hypothetical protein ACCD06_15275 [Azospirillum sp. CT11-132]|uniref:hypothetical protein n=1 Tax=Azospirillum sp. CT11-132 TaxID=3396317 RepID=UPI0039A40117